MAAFALPLVGLVIAIPFLGISSRRLPISWSRSALSAAPAGERPVAPASSRRRRFFLLFEFIFRTPLPKGPLGPLLGMI